MRVDCTQRATHRSQLKENKSMHNSDINGVPVCKWVSCVRLFTYGNVTKIVWMCVSGCRVYVCLRMER